MKSEKLYVQKLIISPHDRKDGVTNTQQNCHSCFRKSFTYFEAFIT